MRASTFFETRPGVDWMWWRRRVGGLPFHRVDRGGHGAVRLGGLDGLRGVAVAAVVLFHAGISWVRGGLLGVDIFFVLSGYLITGLLLDEWRRTGTLSLRGFWGRRARRLLPALLAVLAVVALVWQRVGDLEDVQMVRGDALATLFYVANWHSVLAAHGYFQAFASPAPLLHTWSLAVEEQFYLLWPFLVALLMVRLRSGRLLAWTATSGAVASAAVMAGLQVAGLSADRLYYGTDTRVQALLVGAALVVALYRSGYDLAGHRFAVGGRPLGTAPAPPPPLGRWARRGLSIAGLLAAGLLTWLCSRVEGRSAWLYRGGFLLVAVAVAVVIAAIVLLPHAALARGLSVPPLMALGRISYGVYLWHWPSIVLLDHRRTGLAGWPLTAVRLAVILTISTLSYHLLELPIRQQRWHLPRPWIAVPSLTAGLAVALVIAPLPATPSLQSVLGSADSYPPPRPHSRPPPGRPPASHLPIPAADPLGPRPDHRRGSPPGGTPVSGQQVLAIGDSVLLAVAAFLQQALPGVHTDGMVGRSWTAGLTVLAQHRTAGFAPAVLVVELGTNGPITTADFAAMMRAAAGIPRVIFVTVREPRPWQDQVNATLRTGVSRFPQTRLADWYARSTGHDDDWFYADGVHPRGAGAWAYTDLLIATIRTPTAR